MHFTEDQIYNYIENTLPEDLKNEVKEHLKKCPKCYSTYIELREVMYFQKKGEDIFCNIEVSNGFNIINDKELEGQNLSLNVNKIFFSQELFEEGIKTFLVSFTEQFLIKVDDMALTSMKTSKNLKETIRDLINYLLI